MRKFIIMRKEAVDHNGMLIQSSGGIGERKKSQAMAKIKNLNSPEIDTPVFAEKKKPLGVTGDI